MLTVIADALRIASRMERWEAPDHWQHKQARRQILERERAAIEHRLARYRTGGLW